MCVCGNKIKSSVTRLETASTARTDLITPETSNSFSLDGFLNDVTRTVALPIFLVFFCCCQSAIFLRTRMKFTGRPPFYSLIFILYCIFTFTKVTFRKTRSSLGGGVNFFRCNFLIENFVGLKSSIHTCKYHQILSSTVLNSGLNNFFPDAT